MESCCFAGGSCFGSTNTYHITSALYASQGHHTDAFPLSFLSPSFLAFRSRLKQANSPFVLSLNLFNIALISGSSCCSANLASLSVRSSSAKYI